MFHVRLLCHRGFHIVAFFICFAVGFADESRPGPPAALTDMLISNEDFSYFYMSRPPERMTLEGLHGFVDDYAKGKITHLFFCPNGMAAMFRSKTRNARWDPVNGRESKGKLEQNPKLLYERGLDPYKVWIDRCREKNISPWISMRMNDDHLTMNTDHWAHTDFWRDNPQYWLVPNGPRWFLRHLNYIHKEVREYQMAFIRELFERYDFDGLELDWMRFMDHLPNHLPPGRDRTDMRILDTFMQEARKVAREWEKKRGHPIYIGVRVPFHPDVAAGLNVDAVQWAKQGSVDLIVPSPYHRSTDFDIPVELWRERLDVNSVSRRVALAPCTEMSVRAWPEGQRVRNDLSSLYGFVASARRRGAKNIYLFNVIYLFTRPDPKTGQNNWKDPMTPLYLRKEFDRFVEKGFDEEVIRGSVRRYPLCYHDTVMPGFSADIQLPRTTDKEQAFRMPLGPCPAKEKTRLLVGLGENGTVRDAVLSALLNGKKVEPLSDLDDRGCISPDAVRVLRFECPLDAVREGHNEITVRQESGNPQQIVWIEIRIEP